MEALESELLIARQLRSSLVSDLLKLQLDLELERFCMRCFFLILKFAFFFSSKFLSFEDFVCIFRVEVGTRTHFFSSGLLCHAHSFFCVGRGLFQRTLSALVNDFEKARVLNTEIKSQICEASRIQDDHGSTSSICDSNAPLFPESFLSSHQSHVEEASQKFHSEVEVPKASDKSNRQTTIIQTDSDLDRTAFIPRSDVQVDCFETPSPQSFASSPPLTLPSSESQSSKSPTQPAALSSDDRSLRVINAVYLIGTNSNQQPVRHVLPPTW